MRSIGIFSFLLISFISQADQSILQLQAKPHDITFLAQQMNLSTYDTLKTIVHKTRFILLDFYAPHCHFCKKLKPIFESIAKHYTQIVCITLDASHCDTICTEYHVESIPALLFIKDGIEIDRIEGINTRATLEKIKIMLNN